MRAVRVQLLTFDGCPNARQAREALRGAVIRSGIDAAIEEVDLHHPATAAELRRWSSPTILIDGADVGGEVAPDGGGCRLYGVRRSPSVEAIAGRLREVEGRAARRDDPAIDDRPSDDRPSLVKGKAA